MARKTKIQSKRPIESYEHKDRQRVNNPPVGPVPPDTEPDAGAKQGRSRLDKNLKAEIDQELIEAYRCSVSLPFEPGGNKHIAVKIVNGGIESLKVREVEPLSAWGQAQAGMRKENQCRIG